MQRPKNAGTTLIEILTVIVVFLVGILAIVQIFPPGLSILRTTRGNTIANALSRSEVQRIQGQSSQLADMIQAVDYLGGAAFISINSNVAADELKPPMDTPTQGRLNSTGEIVVAGNPVGQWAKVSGSNIFTRVIGEGRPVPAPRQVGTQFGGLMQLMFAPIYYFVDAGTGVGQAGLLQVYGNDLVRRFGDRSNSGREFPNEFNPRYRDYEFFFIDANDTDGTNYPNQDQIWIGVMKVGGVPVPQSYRVQLSFNYDNGGVISQYDVVVLAEPADGTLVGNYFVVSLQALIGKAGIYGTPAFNSANYRGCDPWTLRVQRLYQELQVGTAFDASNPYQYKVLSANLGSVLINPAAFDYKTRTARGARVPLQARADYTVYDWRIIRDEFRIPNNNLNNVKLILGSIKSRSSQGPDGRTNTGLGGFAAGDQSLWTPDAGGTNGSQDFILQDVETGGILLGNSLGGTSCYFVDKSNGIINFRDSDGNAANGLTGLLSLPTGNPASPWSPGVAVAIGGRNVRALYMGTSEYSVQVLKSALAYRVVLPGGAGSLKAGEAYVGGSNGWGQANRLYFPLADYGQKVTVGEAWVTGGTERVLEELDYKIDGKEDFGGTVLGYTQLPTGYNFDFTQNGYAVRRVRGASMKVRVLWNPGFFNLGTDELENFNRLMKWSESWRRVETESFEAGGTN